MRLSKRPMHAFCGADGKMDIPDNGNYKYMPYRLHMCPHDVLNSACHLHLQPPAQSVRRISLTGAAVTRAATSVHRVRVMLCTSLNDPCPRCLVQMTGWTFLTGTVVTRAATSRQAVHAEFTTCTQAVAATAAAQGRKVASLELIMTIMPLS